MLKTYYRRSVHIRLWPEHFNPKYIQLHDIVSRTASKLIVNEPSEEQKKRVQSLERVEKVRRRQEKDRRSDTKKARSKKWDD